MLDRFYRWIDKRRALRKLWQDDARTLILRGERHAYYDAQRLAARARASGDHRGFLHWIKVANEVARLSPMTEMDLSVLDAIVEEELSKPPDTRGSAS